MQASGVSPHLPGPEANQRPGQLAISHSLPRAPVGSAWTQGCILDADEEGEVQCGEHGGVGDRGSSPSRLCRAHCSRVGADTQAPGGEEPAGFQPHRAALSSSLRGG